MSKTITLRVSDEEYAEISKLAKTDRRPISNFLTHLIFNGIADMFTVDEAEMREILGDKELMRRLERGRQEYKEGKHTIVG